MPNFVKAGLLRYNQSHTFFRCQVFSPLRILHQDAKHLIQSWTCHAQSESQHTPFKMPFVSRCHSIRSIEASRRLSKSPMPRQIKRWRRPHTYAQKNYIKAGWQWQEMRSQCNMLRSFRIEQLKITEKIVACWLFCFFRLLKSRTMPTSAVTRCVLFFLISKVISSFNTSK